MKRVICGIGPAIVLGTLAASLHAAPSQHQKAKPTGSPLIQMTVAKRGSVVFELFTKDAPKTTAQFARLAKSGFYNGIRFHRVRPGQFAHAGDPASRKFSAEQLAPLTDSDYPRLQLGGGGSGKSIPFEESKRSNEAGTLAMALTGPRTDSADSQFFINLAPNHGFDGNYCVFGRVIKGMDVVKKIKQGDLISSMKAVKR